MTQTMKPEEMAKRIIALEKQVEILKESLDDQLSEEDVEAIEQYRKEKAEGKLVSMQDLRREIDA